MANEEGSRRGKIYCVQCTNFVTYDEVLFFPNDYLNVIIGPNGTGKSTLVSAIVLGLGGHPKLLSRSTDLQDYIKYMQQEAEIEIHLYKNTEDVTIIARTFNKSGIDVFKVDGKQMSHKAAVQFVRNDFNIQIDNLCQFLPQDRVQDFAKMNPQEILRNTQTSACPPEVTGQFESLIELRNRQKNINTNTEKMRKDLDDMILKNEALRPQVENIRERLKLVGDIEMCQRKKSWLELEDCLAKLKVYETDMKNAQNSLAKSKKKLEPRLAEANQIKTIQKAMDDIVSSESQKKAKASSEVYKLEENLTALDSEFNKVHSDQLEVSVLAREQAHEIHQETIVFKALSQDVANARQKYGNQDQFKVELDTAKQTSLQLNGRKSQLMHDLGVKQDKYRQEIQYQITSTRTRLQNLENVEKKKLELFAAGFEQAYKATLWLKDHQPLFKGRVFRPILLELNVLDQANAKYLENVIPNRDLEAFTFESNDDIQLFINEVRGKLNLAVNTVQSDPADEVLYVPSIPLDNIRQFGFHTYLIDMISGPPQILNYLCRTYHLHEIPVGTNATFDRASQVPSNIRQFFTPNDRFIVSVSRYTNQKSSATFEIRPRNLLDAGVDREAVEKCKNNLSRLERDSDARKTDMNRIENDLRRLDEELAAVNTQRRKIEENMNAVKLASEKLCRQELKLQKIKGRMINVPEERAKFKERMVQIMRNRLELHKKIAEKIVVLQKACAACDVGRERIRIYHAQNADIDAQIEGLEEGVRTATILVASIKGHVEAQKAQHTKKLAEVNRLCNGNIPSDRLFPYKAQFQQLPQTLETLEEKMFELNARIQCMVAETGDIQDEYERRGKAIEKLRKEIDDTENSFGKLQGEIDQIHAQWYPTIEGIIQHINTTFQNFMNSMGFSGEIRLEKKEDHDYADYGVVILVKYRNDEKLQALDRFVQSGGERAVAIAIYTLSLQQLSHVPFRCVDEINQGMDPRNERRVFEMLVRETCQPNKAQYFFVTPKLLPNLPYNELMTIHVVHNGPEVGSPHVFCADQLVFEDDED